MRAFIGVFSTRDEFGSKNYPSLFAFFALFKPCANFGNAGDITLIGFWSDKSAREVKDAMLEHLHDKDEVLVFDIRSASWKADEQRDARLRDFLRDASFPLS
jgi:hypothetical protein